MKITAGQIESFIKKPPSECMVFLIYGPDEGLMRQRAKTIALTIVDDLQDPFNVVDLDGTNIKENPATLADELAAMSMMGGRRLIRIRDGADKIADILPDILANCPVTDNVIIIEAGDLKPSSKLRKLCEKQTNTAAIPCYAEDARDLGRVISGVFSNANINITPEALRSLSAKLVGDRAMAMQMAEKIITYIGEDKTEITLDDVLACSEDSSALFMSDIAKNAMSGEIEKSDLFLQRLFQEGTPPVAICRGLYNYINRVVMAKTYVENGDNIDFATKKLRPPIFYKDKNEFISHMRIWSIPALNTILEQIMETEAACKTSKTPNELLCDRLVFRIAHMAKRLKQKQRAA